ncbi:hypothetical protein B9Z55_003958 [Caenorhabditis nigoni]|uniref:Uncharacterized protein n=1 Tax=Caenorhabditis nigoni TaxID=1611254 RepID=A0A2G5VT97_9PELO|nr:hypothetical protein B9Z55_003958 [Caenorhabditis nigoni]
MSEELLKWRDGTVRVAGIALSLLFVMLYFIYLCLAGVSRRHGFKPSVTYAADDDVVVLRRISDLPDLTPPPAYDAVREAPPPSYNSVVHHETI